MTDGYNRVQVLGNLGADPELRASSGGTAVLKMRIACSESYLDKNRQRQERTEWVNVVVFGKRAEGLAKCLSKGSRVFVEGSLRTSSYEKNGEKRYRTEVNALNVVLCDSRRGATAQGATEQDATDFGNELDAATGGSGGGDDDFPF